MARDTSKNDSEAKTRTVKKARYLSRTSITAVGFVLAAVSYVWLFAWQGEGTGHLQAQPVHASVGLGIHFDVIAAFLLGVVATLELLRITARTSGVGPGAGPVENAQTRASAPAWPHARQMLIETERLLRELERPLHAVIEETESSAVDIIERTRRLDGMVHEALRGLEEDNLDAQSLGRLGHELSRDIVELLGAIQTQDVVRQRVERVLSALARLKVILSRFEDATANPPDVLAGEASQLAERASLDIGQLASAFVAEERRHGLSGRAVGAPAVQSDAANEDSPAIELF